MTCYLTSKLQNHACLFFNSTSHIDAWLGRHAYSQATTLLALRQYPYHVSRSSCFVLPMLGTCSWVTRSIYSKHMSLNFHTQHHTMTDTAKIVAKSCPVGTCGRVGRFWLDDINNFTRFRSVCNHRLSTLLLILTSHNLLFLVFFFSNWLMTSEKR